MPSERLAIAQVTPFAWEVSHEVNDYVARVYAVTPQQVQEAAKKYIQDDKATIVVVGDKKVVQEQVKEFGPVK